MNDSWKEYKKLVEDVNEAIDTYRDYIMCINVLGNFYASVNYHELPTSY